MNDKETEFLNRLFSGTPGETDDTEMAIPLVDVPDHLPGKLHAIADSKPVSALPLNQRVWPKLSGIAASVLVAVIAFQLIQQQQMLRQLEQAQADLATALHYLGEANRITRAQVYSSLNQNMQRAAVAPVIEIGRDAVLPGLKPKSSAPETNTPTRSL